MDTSQDPNQITPSTPEQVQVVEGQQQPAPETPPEPAQPDPTPAPEEQPTGYDAFTDDDFRNGYAELSSKMGREFGIRQELVNVDGITDATKFKNVLVVAKKE